MPISVQCGDCDAKYRVKDDAAGKQLKCKACGATIPIPAADGDGGEDDFLSGLNAAAKAEKRSSAVDDDDEEFAQMPAARAPKAAGKKRSSRSAEGGSGSGSGGKVARIIGGVIGGLVAMGFAARLVMGLAGNLPSFGFGWTTFKHPGGDFQVDMPGTAKQKVMPGMHAQQQLWGVDGRRYACAVLWGPLPADVAAVAQANPDLVFSGAAEGAKASRPGAQVKSMTAVTVGGITGREITVSASDQSSILRMFVANGNLYGTEFTFRGSTPPGDIKKFHDSFKFTFAGAPNAAPGMPGAPAMPGVTPATMPSTPPAIAPPGATTPPAAPAGTLPPGAPGALPPGAPGAAAGATPAVVADNRPWLERRKAFTTKLEKQKKAPQEYEQETPPANVTAVTYASNGQNLKAWVYKPPTGGPKFPVLVYFHGGFAFGMEDLEVCKPFMDAGYAVLAPSLRGENGNGGIFELFWGELDDARAACQWIAQQPYVDASRIYTFGHSVGGGVSAMLSLMDNVPVKHGGSSGGLYDESTFIQWLDITPFTLADPTERKLRVLVGNIKDMQRPHYAYIGSTDVAFHATEARAKVEVATGSKLTTVRVPGDHSTSLEPAIRQYLAIVQLNP